MSKYTPPENHSDPTSINSGDVELPLEAWDHTATWSEAACLLDVNQPSSYQQLSDEEKAALQAWIEKELCSSTGVGLHASYSLKHIFERQDGGFYVTNGAFKGAMVVAGYRPVDADELNWRFRYSTSDRKRFKRSIGHA